MRNDPFVFVLPHSLPPPTPQELMSARGVMKMLPSRHDTPGGGGDVGRRDVIGARPPIKSPKGFFCFALGLLLFVTSTHPSQPFHSLTGGGEGMGRPISRRQC